MVPIPTSLSTPTPATEVNSSGAEDPAAMKVAPATSSLRSSLSEIASSEGTKKSSQMIATPTCTCREIKSCTTDGSCHTYKEREDEECIWDKENVSTVGFLKVTLFPCHSFVASVAGVVSVASVVSVVVIH